MAERIQLRRTKGWRKPEGAIVVARPSKWGNPFVPILEVGSGTWRISARLPAGPSVLLLGHEKPDRTSATEEAIRLYGLQLLHAAEDEDEPIGDYLAELRGHDLCCWCPLGSPCHADVLLELANE